MTKADIVNEVSKNTGIEKLTVQKAVEAFMETVKESFTVSMNASTAFCTVNFSIPVFFETSLTMSAFVIS